MRITVKSSGLLLRHLPPERQGNSAPLDVATDATPQDVMAQLGMAPEGSYLVILNGQSLPKAERGTRTLVEGDLLAIMPPLKGG